MNSKRRVGIFFLLVIGGLLGLYMYKKYRIAPSIPLLQQELYNENGEKTNLLSYKGKPLIISYYASWCGDCIKELKELNAVKDQEFPGVTVICITDETQEKLVNFKSNKGYNFIFYRLPVSFSEIDIHSIPVTYLVNPKGKMVYNKVGAVKWKDEAFREYAKKLLSE